MEKTSQKLPFFFKNLQKRINFVLLIFLACSVFLTFFVGCFVNINICDFFYAWGFLCVVNFIIYPKFFMPKTKIEKYILFIGLALIGWMLVSSLINMTVKVNNFDILFYALLFWSILKLEKKELKTLLFIVIISISFSALLGIIDPFAYFMPGFSQDTVQTSTFFFWYNYSSTVCSIVLILCFNLLIKEKNPMKIGIFIICFCVLSLFLYFNCSSAGITSVYLVLIAEIIFFWIKNKKFPIKLFSILLSFFAFAFIVELHPNITEIRTCKYNYFIEVLDYFDNIFNTNLTYILFGIGNVSGSDGYDRPSLLANAVSTLCGSNTPFFFEKVKIFLFGLGGGTVHELRPHNLFVGLWADFGIVFALLHLTFVVLILVFAAKNSKKDEFIWPLFFSCIAYLFITCFGSLIVYHYVYFAIMLAALLNFSKSEAPSC